MVLGDEQGRVYPLFDGRRVYLPRVFAAAMSRMALSTVWSFGSSTELQGWRESLVIAHVFIK